MFGNRPSETGDVGLNEFYKISGWPALAIQYRLSRDKKTTFAAALQNGITVYVYTLEVLKIPPSQIAFAGDSAGGNLVVALLRYINEENPGRKAFTPEGWDSSNSWITFLGNETQLGIPVFVNAGTSEDLYNDTMKFAENLRKKGNEVEVLETPNAAHVGTWKTLRLFAWRL
ncbi:hypothetical protein AtubIFM57258_009634 [Aspergillus tubingensis]|nr:hypothetical protein AtubIFM57258_009634 [Aspergillus tubingensis]